MPVRITQADLRQAMRDARYWKPGHPERAAFNAWVTDGFRALNPPDAAPRGAVWVKAYTRDGRTVAAHWRSAPPLQMGAGASSDGQPGRAGSGHNVELAQLRLLERFLSQSRRSFGWTWVRRSAERTTVRPATRS
jgi:hypothetical protein